jgi:hypothetical protein
MEFRGGGGNRVLEYFFMKVELFLLLLSFFAALILCFGSKFVTNQVVSVHLNYCYYLELQYFRITVLVVI